MLNLLLIHGVFFNISLLFNALNTNNVIIIRATPFKMEVPLIVHQIPLIPRDVNADKKYAIGILDAFNVTPVSAGAIVLPNPFKPPVSAISIHISNCEKLIICKYVTPLTLSVLH